VVLDSRPVFLNALVEVSLLAVPGDVG
jgi:hypothetical protein